MTIDSRTALDRNTTPPGFEFEPLTATFQQPHPDDAHASQTAGGAVAATGPGDALRALATSGGLDVPLPASGQTWQRFRRIAEIAAVDLSLGRLAEGHMDAVAILAEARREPDGTALHGVWAANGEVLIRPGTGTMVLHGERAYCSGAGLLDRALITSVDPDGKRVLALANLWHAGVHIQPDSWRAVGMAESLSATVSFHAVPSQAVGPDDFYINRPGFWRGSVGVAAAWYGGALGLARAVAPALERDDPFARYQAAELHIAIAGMRLSLQQAAAEIDGGHESAIEAPMARAMLVRHHVYEGCRTVLEIAGQAGGTGLATHDAGFARRFADLPVYLRQHHPSRDLPALATALTRGAGGGR